MGTIEGMLDQPVILRIGWTLLHFAWQGIMVGFLLAIALAVLRRRSPNARYLAASLAMVTIAVLPVATFLTLPEDLFLENGTRTVLVGEEALLASLFDDLPAMVPTVIPEHQASTTPPSDDPFTSARHPEENAQSNASWQERLQQAVMQSLPWLVLTWLAGVSVLSVRLAGGAAHVRRLKRRHTHTVPEFCQQAVTRLSTRLDITRTVRIVESTLAQAPLVLGWFRPMILLPTSALTGLSSEQIEAIIAHELAHIRRHDYIVNLLQAIVETLLFYHPVVWWVSRRMRAEREQCCDDLAVQACVSRLTYIRALTELEELLAKPTSLAVAASGGPLLRRIRRLANPVAKQANHSTRRTDGPAILLVMFALALGIGLHLTGVVAHAYYASLDSLDDSMTLVTQITNTTTRTTYVTIQEAIDEAASGDEIVLPPRRYTGDGNRDLDLHGKAITVRSIDPADDAIVATTVIDCQGTENDRHRGFQFFSGEGPASVIDGLTVTNGFAPLLKAKSYEYALGGGIACCPKSHPTIRNCRIIGNTASAKFTWGGGIYGAPTLRRCVISGNVAKDIGNAQGGGIYCGRDASPTITDCVFTGNLAVYGAGLKCANATLINCTIVGNPAHISGGGVHSQGTPTLINCLISGNTAGLSGGGFFGARTETTFINCTIANNLAAKNGGGFYCKDFSDISVINTIIADNVAAEARQIVVTSDDPREPQPTRLDLNHSAVEGTSEAFYVKEMSKLEWGEGSTHAHPQFAEALTGQWTQPAEYDAETMTITFIDNNANWPEGALVGRTVNPAVKQWIHFLIIANSANTITAHVDHRTIADGKVWIANTPYKIFDYRCATGSPSRDAGDNEAVYQDLSDLDQDGNTDEPIPFDLFGQPRFANDPQAPDLGNPDEEGLPIVSMGAYE